MLPEGLAGRIRSFGSARRRTAASVLPGKSARRRPFGLALEGGGVPKIAVEELPHLAVVVEIIVRQARKMREPLRRDGHASALPRRNEIGENPERPGTPAGSCRNQAYAV